MGCYFARTHFLADSHSRLIDFLVEIETHCAPLREIGIPSIREILDPLASELAERIEPLMSSAERLSVSFTIQPEGEVGIEFRGDGSILEKLDDALDDMELSPPEDDDA